MTAPPLTTSPSVPRHFALPGEGRGIFLLSENDINNVNARITDLHNIAQIAVTPFTPPP